MAMGLSLSFRTLQASDTDSQREIKKSP